MAVVKLNSKGRVGLRTMIKAKCRECMGDVSRDCETTNCPLYGAMPKAKLEPTLNWLVEPTFQWRKRSGKVTVMQGDKVVCELDPSTVTDG